MSVVISLLRGINVGGRHMVPMTELRAIYEGLGAESVQTYLQSGNVVFRGPERMESKIAAAVEARFGFKVEVIHRSTPDWRKVLSRNPFPGKEGNRVAVTFFTGKPAASALEGLDTAPEQHVLVGRELYTWYPNGMARPKVPMARIEKILGMPGTARNFNTVMKLMEMAEKLQ